MGYFSELEAAIKVALEPQRGASKGRTVHIRIHESGGTNKYYNNVCTVIQEGGGKEFAARLAQAMVKNAEIGGHEDNSTVGVTGLAGAMVPAV